MLRINPKTVLIITDVKVRGGKRTHTTLESADHNGQASEYTKRTIIHVDNREERKRAEDFAAKARNVARGVATYGPLGYITSLDNLSKVLERADTLAQEAQDLNKSLGTCQVHFRVLHQEIGVQMSPEVVQAVFDDVRDQLSELKRHVMDGAKDIGTKVYNKLRNVAALTTGIQADSISYALTEAKEALKNGEPLPSTPHLDNAITLLEPVDPAMIPEAL